MAANNEKRCKLIAKYCIAAVIGSGLTLLVQMVLPAEEQQIQYRYIEADCPENSNFSYYEELTTTATTTTTVKSNSTSQISKPRKLKRPSKKKIRRPWTYNCSNLERNHKYSHPPKNCSFEKVTEENDQFKENFKLKIYQPCLSILSEIYAENTDFYNSIQINDGIEIFQMRNGTKLLSQSQEGSTREFYVLRNVSAPFTPDQIEQYAKLTIYKANLGQYFAFYVITDSPEVHYSTYFRVEERWDFIDEKHRHACKIRYLWRNKWLKDLSFFPKNIIKDNTEKSAKNFKDAFYKTLEEKKIKFREIYF